LFMKYRSVPRRPACMADQCSVSDRSFSLTLAFSSFGLLRSQLIGGGQPSSTVGLPLYLLLIETSVFPAVFPVPRCWPTELEKHALLRRVDRCDEHVTRTPETEFFLSLFSVRGVEVLTQKCPSPSPCFDLTRLTLVGQQGHSTAFLSCKLFPKRQLSSLLWVTRERDRAHPP